MKEKNKRNTGTCSVNRLTCLGNLIWGLTILGLLVAFIINIGK